MMILRVRNLQRRIAFEPMAVTLEDWKLPLPLPVQSDNLQCYGQERFGEGPDCHRSRKGCQVILRVLKQTVQERDRKDLRVHFDETVRCHPYWRVGKIIATGG
jgi:hypothetical protein